MKLPIRSSFLGKLALVPALLALALSSARASYYDMVPRTDPHEVITFDVRYPYSTHGIYIATYPQDCLSKEGWMGQYYGGVVWNDQTKRCLIQYSTWQMHGKGAPATGIDIVHAGPYGGWHRSTWEGSSAGIPASWPESEFQVNEWYRFVQRTWTPADGKPHTGYAGVWLKNLKTQQWVHVMTAKFPAELTGLSNMQGFMEWFGRAPDKAAAEFRNVYSITNGKWVSQSKFSCTNTSHSKVRLQGNDSDRSVLMETLDNPADPQTKKRKNDEPVVRQSFELKQPDQPDFLDQPKMESATAERLGRELVLRWKLAKDSAPQLGYIAEVKQGNQVVAKVTKREPEDRQVELTLPEQTAGPLTVSLVIQDIFNQSASPQEVSCGASVPMAAVNAEGQAPGLAYRYYESEKASEWDKLPDFAKLTAKHQGIVATPDLTARTRRNDYAFQFEGFLKVPKDGLYTFRLIEASGARLMVNGQMVIDADGDQSIACHAGSIALKAGLQPIVLSYYHGWARGDTNQNGERNRGRKDDFLQLNWAGPGMESAPIPAANFVHAAKGQQATLAVAGRYADAVHLELASRLTGVQDKPKRVDYYATNPHFDYYSQQQASSAEFFLASANAPEEKVTSPVWGDDEISVRARATLADGTTIDSQPVRIKRPTAKSSGEADSVKLTPLEHHLYPMNYSMSRGEITLVGESIGLLTRKYRGDVTIVAHLAGITPNTPRADGTSLPDAQNFYSGIILRQNLNETAGMPLGGAKVPYISLMGAASGSSLRCDSTQINGAGNQPTTKDMPADAKWFKLTRKGQVLTAFVSKDGKEWKQVQQVSLPYKAIPEQHNYPVAALEEEMEVGFVHYGLPSPTPIVHWATFDNVKIQSGAE